MGLFIRFEFVCILKKNNCKNYFFYVLICPYVGMSFRFHDRVKVMFNFFGRHITFLDMIYASRRRVYQEQIIELTATNCFNMSVPQHLEPITLSFFVFLGRSPPKRREFIWN